MFLVQGVRVQDLRWSSEVKLNAFGRTLIILRVNDAWDAIEKHPVVEIIE
ncbi:MAG: hypothetical protein AAGL66_18155 [Pseudomonadota bacterium]